MRYTISLAAIMALTFIVGLLTQHEMPTLSTGAFVTSGLSLVAALMLNALSDMKDGPNNS